MKSISFRLLAPLLAALLAFTGIHAAELSTIAPGLMDVGVYDSTHPVPFVDICSGQSNAQGADNGGSKVVQPNILSTDSVASPTQVYAAAFGTAPYNGTVGGGTTANPALAYNNACLWFANNIRLNGGTTAAPGMIPAARPIVNVPNFLAAQSINQWVGNGTATITGTPTTGDVVSLIATSTQLSGSPITVSYTVQGGDTTTSIATGLSAAINANTTLAAANVYGISATNVTTPTYPTNLGIAWTSSVTGSATETVTLSFPTPPMWTALQANLAVVATAYPGFAINHVMWLQGENDSSGTYASKANYQIAFTVLQAQYRALSQWTPSTTMSVQELLAASDNTGQARNDFIRTTNLGYFEKSTTMVTSAGMVESTENPGPHFDGNSLVALGARHFAAWNAGRIDGAYTGANTYYGSSLAQLNLINAPATGLTINQDDIRTGALIIASGGTITLPNPATSLSLPIYVSTTASTTLAATGTLTRANVGTTTSITMSGGSFWRIELANATSWRATEISNNGVGKGDFSRYTSNGAVTGAQSFTGSVQLTGTAYTLNGATISLTPSFGMDSIFVGSSTASSINLTSGTFTLPDGTTTASSITVLPGEQVWLFGGISGASGLSTYVLYDSAASAQSIQRDTPTTGTTITSNPGFGNLTHVIEPAGTIAALTITLPATPKNASKVTYIAVAAVTAVTFSGGTVVGAPSGFTAGQKYTLTWNAAQSKWY